MNRLKPIIAAAFLAIVGTAQAQSDGDAEAGAQRAAQCAGCHGLDGKATQPSYPNIGGQHASYIAKQLTEYRSGDRQNSIMNGIAGALSDEDIVNLAAHYSQQELTPGVANEENLETGETIYRGGITSADIASCTACHGPQGYGNLAAVYPVLSGQNAEYTAQQLRYFRSGERNNDPNAMMRMLAHRLTDGEIDIVSNYIQGLH